MTWPQLVRQYAARWRQALEEALAGGEPADTFDGAVELWRIGHKLHGTAEAYGFPQLSSLGYRLQALVADAVRQRRGLSPGERQDAARLLGEGVRLLAQGPSAAHEASCGPETPFVGPDVPAARHDRPIPASASDDKPTGADGSRRRPAAGQATAGLKVAYLDDDAFMREWLRRTLPAGTEYLACATPAELRECLSRFAPDVILIDLVLGDASGYDVCADLKRDAALARVPVFLVSASGGFADRVRAIQVGAETILPKPFDPADLVQRVLRLRELEAGPPRPSRIAVVDDSEEAIRLVSFHLAQAGFTVQSTRRPMEALDLLRSFQPDLLLLDMDMPEASGVDVCRAIRREPGFEMLPIVFLTARADDEAKLQGLRAGADDYITKPFSPAELVARVTGRLERVRLYRSLAIRDGLTGAFNHAYFQEQLRKELATARRYQRPLSVALIDVDRFKEVNDRFGHMVGDHVLRGLATLLQTRLRRGDTVARYGGEEFALILLEVGKEDALPVVDRLRQLFEQEAFAAPGSGEVLKVTFSGGVSAFPGDGVEPQDLIRQADMALYAAKRSGRNRVLPA